MWAPFDAASISFLILYCVHYSQNSMTVGPLFHVDSRPICRTVQQWLRTMKMINICTLKAVAALNLLSTLHFWSTQEGVKFNRWFTMSKTSRNFCFWPISDCVTSGTSTFTFPSFSKKSHQFIIILHYNPLSICHVNGCSLCIFYTSESLGGCHLCSWQGCTGFRPFLEVWSNL